MITIINIFVSIIIKKKFWIKSILIWKFKKKKKKKKKMMENFFVFFFIKIYWSNIKLIKLSLINLNFIYYNIFYLIFL